MTHLGLANPDPATPGWVEFRRSDAGWFVRCANKWHSADTFVAGTASATIRALADLFTGALRDHASAQVVLCGPTVGFASRIPARLRERLRVEERPHRPGLALLAGGAAGARWVIAPPALAEWELETAPGAPVQNLKRSTDRGEVRHRLELFADFLGSATAGARGCRAASAELRLRDLTGAEHVVVWDRALNHLSFPGLPSTTPDDPHVSTSQVSGAARARGTAQLLAGTKPGFWWVELPIPKPRPLVELPIPKLRTLDELVPAEGE